MIGSRGSKDDEEFTAALAGRGPRNSDIQQLVDLAESLCEAAVEPSADFVVKLRAEIMADAATVLVVTAKPARVHSRQPVAHPIRRRLAAATAGTLATAGMIGIVASSAQAVPGEMLYPVKRGVESIQLATHRSDDARGSFQLSQATERLAEAQALAAKGDTQNTDLVVQSLSDFSDTASSGSEALFSDYASGGYDASINKVNTFATASSTTLSALSANFSPEALGALKAAATTVSDLAAQAAILCNACAKAELGSLAQTVASIARAAASMNAGLDQPITTDRKKATSEPKTSRVAPPKLPLAPLSTTPTAAAADSPDVTKPIVGTPPSVKVQEPLVPGLLDALIGN